MGEGRSDRRAFHRAGKAGDGAREPGLFEAYGISGARKESADRAGRLGWFEDRDRQGAYHFGRETHS